jgi:hypothetical protein
MRLKDGKMLSEQKEKEEEFNVKTLNEEYLRKVWELLFDIPYSTKPIKVFVLTLRDFTLLKFIYGKPKGCMGFMRESDDEKEYIIVLPEGYIDMFLYHELIHVYEIESLKYYTKKEG